jgi:anti-sigma regulatory factor (Ser/Thr protein kinase)
MREVRSKLRKIVPTGVTDNAIGDVVLLASELITNAMIHTVGAVGVRAWRSADAEWRVEVSDESRARLRVPTMPQVSSVSGRGLSIVDAISTRWGSVNTAGGKRTWFEICP